MARDELNRSGQQEGDTTTSKDEAGTLKHQNKRYAQGYAMVPNWVIREVPISRDAKLLYGILQSYAWLSDNSFPGYETLMEDMQCGRKQLAKYIKELKDAGLIKVKRRGQGYTNIYTIVDWTREDYFMQQHSPKNGVNRARSSQKETSRSAEKGTSRSSQKETVIIKSKNEKGNNEKSKFRKANALKTEKGGEGGSADARSHRERRTTRKQNSEVTKEQKGRGVTFSPNEEGTTNKQDVQGRTQQVTPTSMVPKSGQENTERSTNVPPLTKNQAHTQKRIVKNEASKQRTPAYIGQPLTQEEIDAKKKQGRNASGLTPLSHIIPASHWQELEARAANHPPTNGNGSSNGGLHYDRTTKNAPLSIDATIEEISYLCHDEPASIAQNINRAAKLCKQAGLDPSPLTDILWSVYHEKIKHLPDKVVKTRRADGRPNKMLLFFAELEKAIGVKPKPPN